ncbi:MAG: radical SAM protein [Deltaproteobacteria bacterium]|nr:radical SAM protein [Deltaproteobacteria bacterium]
MSEKIRPALVSASGLKSVNIHITKFCNLACRFCFARFNDRAGPLIMEAWKKILALLRAAGVEKINFAGGEPTLYRGLGDVIEEVHRLGMTCSIVTNGAQLEPLLRAHADALDWVGLSVDSADEAVQRQLGRGGGTHVARSIELGRLARSLGVRVKLNSVITTLNWQEDLGPLVDAIAPERWKAFQVLEIEGENHDTVKPLLITSEQFASFVERHARFGDVLVPETNDAILESYAMIDPLGCFFSDSGQKHTYSDPILEVGVERALAQVVYRREKTAARGGFYDWARPRSRRAPFIVLEGLDCSGKSTIAEALARRLGGTALDTPGATLRSVRAKVHEGLGHDQNGGVLFYLASVFAQGERARALTADGTAVVMDRYWLSSVGYGAARRADVDVASLALRVPPPDLTVLLTINEAERQRRLESRGCTREDAETLDPVFRDTVLRTMRAEQQPEHLRPSLEIDVTSKTVDEIVDVIARQIERLPHHGRRQGLISIAGHRRRARN